MSDGFTIEGNSSNVVARLDSIDERVASRLASAMQALESELIGEIKARTPVRSGALVASIQGRVAAGPTGAIAEITANPTGGMSKGSRAASYALFNDYGTKERFHKRPPAGGEAPPPGRPAGRDYYSDHIYIGQITFDDTGSVVG